MSLKVGDLVLVRSILDVLPAIPTTPLFLEFDTISNSSPVWQAAQPAPFLFIDVFSVESFFSFVIVEPGMLFTIISIG